MYEVTICDTSGSFHTYMCRNFGFSSAVFTMDAYDNPVDMEIKTVFFPLINIKWIESKSIMMDHEENHEATAD